MPTLPVCAYVCVYVCVCVCACACGSIKMSMCTHTHIGTYTVPPPTSIIVLSITQPMHDVVEKVVIEPLHYYLNPTTVRLQGSNA